MKNIRHFTRFLFLLSVVFLPLTSFSQTSVKGYEIRFKPLNVSEKYLYLTGIYGNTLWVVDSAKNAKNQYIFKNTKQLLPAGLYTIQSQDGTILVEFIIAQTQKFTIEENKNGFVFINSEENVIFQLFKTDLKDFFVESLFPRTAENVIQSIENLFNRMLDKNPTLAQLDVRDFYLKKLIHRYMNLDPKFDAVFVYIVDNYVSTLTESKFISDAEIAVFKRIADRKRRSLVGETVPVFESYTKDHHLISTAEMPSKYTVLWFWDPDCEHCIEYTPKFYDFYLKYHDIYSFEVIACSVTEDYDRWIAFINDQHLDWFNTSYAIGAPNYDAVEFFNFDDTPAIFIIDKQHKIVARQFPLDELFEVFESLQR